MNTTFNYHFNNGSWTTYQLLSFQQHCQLTIQTVNHSIKKQLKLIKITGKTVIINALKNKQN